MSLDGRDCADESIDTPASAFVLTAFDLIEKLVSGSFDAESEGPISSGDFDNMYLLKASASGEMYCSLLPIDFPEIVDVVENDSFL